MFETKNEISVKRLQEAVDKLLQHTSLKPDLARFGSITFFSLVALLESPSKKTELKNSHFHENGNCDPMYDTV